LDILELQLKKVESNGSSMCDVSTHKGIENGNSLFHGTNTMKPNWQAAAGMRATTSEGEM